MRTEKLQDSYKGVLEDWKIKLIVERASRKHLRRDDMEDAMQEVVMALLDFRFDPARSNGASEVTALKALIDNKLAFIQRGSVRSKRLLQKHLARKGVQNGNQIQPRYEPDHADSLSRSMDVQTVLDSLSLKERAICAMLAESRSRERTAVMLGISRYEVEAAMSRIMKFRLSNTYVARSSNQSAISPLSAQAIL